MIDVKGVIYVVLFSEITILNIWALDRALNITIGG